MWLGKLEKILCFGRVLWSHNNMKMVNQRIAGLLWLMLPATLGGCVTVIGNGLDLAVE